MGDWYFPISSKHYETIGHALASLHDGINEWEERSKTQQHIINKIQYAYHYFRKTGRGTGLVELAAILENEKTGWLLNLSEMADRSNFPKLDQLLGAVNVRNWAWKINRKYPNISDLLANDEPRKYLEIWWREEGRTPKRFPTVIDGLYFFKDVRNKSVHGANSKTGPIEWIKRIEQAFYFFLLFAESYLYDCHNHLPLFDHPKYLKAAICGDVFCDRFQVLDVLGGDEISRTYKVRDLKGHNDQQKGSRDQQYVVKRVSIFSKEYDDIINNETQSRPLFNDNHHVGRFYSSHDEVPVGTLLLLEYVDGWILQNWIEAKKSEKLNSHEFYELIYVIGGVLNALKEIHGHGYVHGNIDMKSIVITRKTKEAKLVSFDKCMVANDYYKFHKDTYDIGKMLENIVNKYTKAELVTDCVKTFIAKAISTDIKQRFQDASSMYEDWLEIYNEIRFTIKPQQTVDHIALISCSKSKHPGPLPAEELYSASPNFHKALEAAKDIHANFDAVYIVSGRYGLVDLRQIIPSYDFDIRQLGVDQQMAWAKNIATVLRVKHGDGSQNVTVFSDKIYASCLLDALEKQGFVPKREQGYFEDYGFTP